MTEQRLEKLTVFVPGERKPNKLEQARENSRIAIEVAAEIKRAKEKMQSIYKIDGRPVSITELHMSGKISIEDIVIKYRSDGKAHTAKYSKEQFYNL